MKKDLLALASKHKGDKKYKPMPSFQTDFITASTEIKDKTIKSNDNNLVKGNLSPINKEVIIKNTSKEETIFNKTNVNNKNTPVFSGSNYNKMVPEVGVIVKQDNQIKNGGLNFQNQFGKMSVKEYEQLRAMYMNGNNNTNKKDNKDNYVVVKDDDSDNMFNKSIYATKYLGKQSYNENIMINSGNIQQYDWKDQSTSSNNKNVNPTQTNITHNGILNEDLFKGKQMRTNKKANTNNSQRNKNK